MDVKQEALAVLKVLDGKGDMESRQVFSDLKGALTFPRVREVIWQMWRLPVPLVTMTGRVNGPGTARLWKITKAGRRMLDE